MLCPLLQSPAVKAIVNPNDHSASQPLSTHTETHTLSLSAVFAPGVLTKQETAGTRQKTALPVRSTCSLILTPGGAWRHCHHTPSLSWAHTHTHAQIDTHTDAHILTGTHRFTMHIYTQLPLVSYLPTSHFFLASFPSHSLQFNPIYILLFVLPPPSLAPHHQASSPNCRMHEKTHTYTHTLTCQVTSEKGRVEEMWQRAEGIVCQEHRPLSVHLCCAGTQRAPAPHLC